MNGKRKLLVVMYALVAGTGLALLRVLDGGQWVTVAVTCVAAYTAGNAAEHYTSSRKEAA